MDASSQRKSARVFCVCSRCRKFSDLDAFGVIHQGKYIARSTSNDHKARDRRASAQTEEESRREEDTGGEVIQGPSDNLNRLNTVRNTLINNVCALAAWLHLVCGLSRSSTSQFLVILGMIVDLAIELGSILSTFTSNRISGAASFETIRLPRDVRTAMSTLNLEPIIKRSVCCPKCFHHYSDSLPQLCTQRETPRSRACGEKLWVKRSTRKGPRIVPRCLYSTQDFESWLEFFLSRPGIEDLLDKSYDHIPSPQNMKSIWDSPAWQSLPNSFSSTRGNLTFSYYIDWFNPFTNKIAGKSVSCGAIMMFCLNLPFDIQYLPENTYFAGITPPPKEPNMVTITAVADPIIERLKPLWTGKIVKTNRHPGGVIKRVAILARIGDLLAMKKALGFAGVAAHNFCSFCKLLHVDLEDLDHTSWEPRTGPEVLVAARAWQEAKTKKRREEIYKEHGVRWSSLHRLPYGDPVRHTVLGVMHNWMEGVLQHHVRVRWGIGIKQSKSSEDVDGVGAALITIDANADSISARQVHPLTVLDHIIIDDDTIYDELEMLDDEIENLYMESRQNDDTPSHPVRLRSSISNTLQDNVHLAGDESDDDDNDFYPDSDSEDDDDHWQAACIFTEGELTRIRACLAEAIIPTWVDRPPTNLGEKAHGKLKADQWFVLFSIFLPLILPEIWTSRPLLTNAALLVDNFYQLVVCTNIVCAYIVTPDFPDAYLDHYTKYRKSSQILFPNVGSRPNHHYAMHNADLMKFWGPLMRLSEFAGERHNGSLQNINTNNHQWEIDFTMLRQMCRRGRLTAYLRNTSFLSKGSGSFEVQDSKQEKSTKRTAGLELVPIDIYNEVLAHVNSTLSNEELPYRHAQDFPHPQEGARVLPRHALPVRRFEHKGRAYATIALHPGNSSVSFTPTTETAPDSGHIEAIWSFNLPGTGTERKFIVLSSHENLSLQDAQLNPYQSKPGFLANIVYTRDPNKGLHFIIIETEAIIGHVAYYSRPPGTFGIKSATTVLVNSLHRYRD